MFDTTDGLSVSSAALGDGLPQGLLVVQDNTNTNPEKKTHNHRHQTPEQRRRSEAELIEARPNPDQSTWRHPIRDTEFSRSVPTELDPTLKRRQGGEGGVVW